MPLTLKAALVTISTLEFDRLVCFYQNLLTQPPITLIPNVYAEFQLPGLNLGIFRPKALLPSTLCPLPSTGISLCLEVENLEDAIAHLVQLGYPPPGEVMTASHGQEIYAYDPDGNWLILHQS